MKLRDLAARLGCRLEGDGDIEIRRVAGIDRAGAGDLTFIANPKYQSQIASTGASAVIVGEAARCPGARAALLRVKDPYLALAEAIRLLIPPMPPPVGIDPASSVAPDATIGREASIGPFVTIGSGASIGSRCVIYPNVVIGPGAHLGDDCVVHSQVSIRERVRIGSRVVVQDGAVVGSDGFGFATGPDGAHVKIPQHADVIVEDDVEIGANATIDRPAVGETRIGAGTKIDNLVQIAHGVAIGRRVRLAAQVGIAGSTIVEDDVVLAGQVGVAGHLRLGRGMRATAQTGIPNSVDAGEFVSGYPAIANREWLKSAAVFRQLPTLNKRVAALEQRILELEEKLAACRTSTER